MVCNKISEAHVELWDVMVLTDKDECSDPTVCLNGVCQNYRGGYQCSCNPGFMATENMTQCVGKNLVLIIAPAYISVHIAFKPRSKSQRYRFNILTKLRLLTLCRVKQSWHVRNILWIFVESQTLDCFTNLIRCCDMLKKSLTRLNFASPSSQLFCTLIKIVKADHLSQTHSPSFVEHVQKQCISLFVWVDIIYAISHSTFSLPLPPQKSLKWTLFVYVILHKKVL